MILISEELAVAQGLPAAFLLSCWNNISTHPLPIAMYVVLIRNVSILNVELRSPLPFATVEPHFLYATSPGNGLSNVR